MQIADNTKLHMNIISGTDKKRVPLFLSEERDS